jgi:hypothetical protein
LFRFVDVIIFRKDYSPPSSPPSRPFNGLPALLTTNAATMTIVKTGATTTATAAMTIKTVVSIVTAANMTTSPNVMAAWIAQEVDKAAVTGLITPSTPSTLVPSTPMTLTSVSC